MADVANSLGIPGPNRRVELVILFEHAFHGSHAGGVPGVDGLVEDRIVEHVTHIRNSRNIPKVDGFVEGFKTVKCLVHVGYSRSVPAVDRTTIRTIVTGILAASAGKFVTIDPVHP